MKTGKLIFAAVLGILLFFQAMTAAQTTAFNYQGRLTDGGNAANGAFQMQFKLFDALSGGSQIGATISNAAVSVSQGIFGVKLDFGANALSGANRWLEIAVRRNSSESYVTLAPREQIASSPYAVRTLSAASADVSTNALNLGGLAANQYVQTSDSRLSDSRNPLPFSSNYIQNTAALQASSNFNISGNGIVGGNFGIGTVAPTAKLSVSTLTTNSGNNTAYFEAPNIGPNVSNIHFGSTGDWFIRSAASSGKVILQDTGGNVGIGINPFLTNVKLEVRTTLSNGVAIYANANSTTGSTVGIWGETLSPDGYAGYFNGRIYVKDNVGIGILSPARLLHVNGRARIGLIPLEASTAQVCFNAAGDLLQCGASSLKWKTNVRPFSSGLDVVMRLRPINFSWKESGLDDFGLGAEEVARVAPQLTYTNANGEVEGVKYDHLSVVFINAFKEQQTQIEVQGELIKNQQRQIDSLTVLVCRMNPQAAICKEKK